MTGKRMGMWILACATAAWTFTGFGCSGGDDGNDCLGVLGAADVEGNYLAQNFTLFSNSNSNCPLDTQNAVLARFLPEPTPTGTPRPAVPKIVRFRYNQRGHDVFVPDPSMTSEFAGCADEDASVRTVASFGHLVDPSSEACSVSGDEVILNTGLGNKPSEPTPQPTPLRLEGVLSFPLQISSECHTCLTSCYVAVGFQLVDLSVGEGTPTPTPDERAVDLAVIAREALQAGLSSAPPNTCPPTRTPTATRPTQTPTNTPTNTPRNTPTTTSPAA